MHRSSLLAPIALLAVHSVSMTRAAGIEAVPEIPPFVATYRVAYKDRDAGSLAEALSFDKESGTYAFSTHLQLEGIYKALAGAGARGESEFALVEGSIAPTSHNFPTRNRIRSDVRYIQR